jgi:hypothetical protein
LELSMVGAKIKGAKRRKTGRTAEKIRKESRNLHELPPNEMQGVEKMMIAHFRRGESSALKSRIRAERNDHDK